MAKAHMYKIKNIRTGEYMQGVYRAGQVQELIGLRHDVNTYAARGQTWGGKYKIEYADDSEELAKPVLLGWESEWQREWDKARMKLLKAYGLA